MVVHWVGHVLPKTSFMLFKGVERIFEKWRQCSKKCVVDSVKWNVPIPARYCSVFFNGSWFQMPETKTGNDRFNDSIILLSFSSEIQFQCLVGQVCKKASAIDTRESLEERKGLMNLDLSVLPSVRKFSWNWSISFFSETKHRVRDSCGIVWQRHDFFYEKSWQKSTKWSKMSQDRGLETFVELCH